MIKSPYLFPFIFFLFGCSTPNNINKISIIKPDPSIMLSCDLKTYSLKPNDNLSDIAQIFINLRSDLDDCSLLNERKKAYIDSVISNY